MHKYYVLETFGRKYKIWLEPLLYTTENLAVQVYDEDNEPFDIITVNLPDEELSGDFNCTAFIDTNNVEGLWSFLIKNGIAEFTGRVGHSGFCSYPEFKFNLEKLG